MSNIDFSTIDITYPIAGQNNDSQGFRDNYAAIKNALALAKSEISNLEDKVLVNTSLFGNGIAINDLLGSKLTNGSLVSVYQESDINSVITITHAVNMQSAGIHELTITESTTLNFVNWPNDGMYASIRIHLLSDTSGIYNVLFNTENTGTLLFDTDFPMIGSEHAIAVNVNGKHKVIDVWSYDNGAHVFVNYVGEF